jgi:hypothetical protein
MELGNHAEFLGVMKRSEMLSMFFTHDSGDTSKWRIKGHAKDVFWEWVASWGCVLNKPSDLGYPDNGFDLPPLKILDCVVNVNDEAVCSLFQDYSTEKLTLSQRIKVRRDSIHERVARCAEIVNQSTSPFLVWCELNEESSLLTKSIPGAVEVKGSDDPARKESALTGFSDGNIRVLVTKPSIAGMDGHPADPYIAIPDRQRQSRRAPHMPASAGCDRKVRGSVE